MPSITYNWVSCNRHIQWVRYKFQTRKVINMGVISCMDTENKCILSSVDLEEFLQV